MAKVDITNDMGTQGVENEMIFGNSKRYDSSGEHPDCQWGWCLGNVGMTIRNCKGVKLSKTKVVSEDGIWAKLGGYLETVYG